LGDISEAILRLVQEGKQKGYLTKAIKLVINEVGWEPDVPLYIMQLLKEIPKP
jgi:hypothetical protein